MTGTAPRTLEHATPVVNRENPWPGLAAFSEDQAEFFFGREREVEDLFRRVRFNSLSVLYGQSGLGKTSLVQAALFPRLRSIGILPVAIRIDYSAQAPAARLQICQAIGDAVEATGGTVHRIGDRESLWEYFHREAAAATDASGKPLILALAFDQFEELFTLGYDRGDARGFAADFIEELGSLSEHRPPRQLEAEFEHNPGRVAEFDFDRQDYRLLLSLREDFLAHLHDLSARIPSITVNNMRLTPLDGIKALEVVERPGKGLVAPGAAEAIIRFVADAGDERRDASSKVPNRPIESVEVDPSLLSLFLRELNEKRGTGLVTPALVAASREKILAEFYERSLADLHPGVRLFVEEDLLTAKGFRQTLSVDSAEAKLVEYGAPPAALVTLVNRRLLHYEQRGRLTRVELTHDVLTRVVRDSRSERQAKEAEENRRHEAEESKRRAEAARAATEAELVHVRKRQRATRVLLGVVAIAAAAAVGFALQARNSTRVLRLTQQGLEDSTRAAQQARAQAETDRAQAEADRASAVLAQSSAESARSMADAALTRSGQMLAAFCRYGLSVINRFGDSTAGKPELTNAYAVLLELSDSSVERMVADNRHAACPHQLEARTQSAMTGILVEQGKNEEARRRGYKALEVTRGLLGFRDSISRRVAAQSYFDLTYQLWRIDANDSAAAAARAGSRLGVVVDPRGDSSAFNRLARAYHYGALAILDIAKNDTSTTRRRGLIDEARAMADSGIAVVDRGLRLPGQIRNSLLFSKSQLWLRRGEADSSARDTTGALLAFRNGVAIAAELHTAQRTMSSRRWRAITRSSLGGLAHRLRKYEEARAAHDTAVADWGVYLETYRNLNNQTEMEAGYDGIAVNLMAEARDVRALGQTARVIALVRQAVDSADASYRVRGSVAAIRTRGSAYNSAGDIAESLARRELADSYYVRRIRLDSLTFARESSNLAAARSYEQALAALVRVTQQRTAADTASKPAVEAIRVLRAAEDRIRRLRERVVTVRRQTLSFLEPTLRPRADSIRRAGVLRDSVAEALGNLSWSELLVDRPEQALEHARESVRLTERYGFVPPNLFNAIVLTGDDEAAARYYRTSETRQETATVTFPCAVVRDIRVLRWRGVATDRHVQLVERLAAPRLAQCLLPTLPTR